MSKHQLISVIIGLVPRAVPNIDDVKVPIEYFR